MAETAYFSVVTDFGTAEMMKAVNEKRKVNITEFAVGDGGGQYYKPDTAMTELKHEVWRGSIGSCGISRESENVMIVETVIPSNEGGFTIREMAVFDENGIMIAVCNTPDTAKVKVTDGVVHELLVQMEILLDNKESVQLMVDPNVVVATKKDLLGIKKRLAQLETKVAWMISLLCGYYYNKSEKKIVSLLPHNFSDGILTFPEGAAYADGSTIVLQGGLPEGFPPLPEGEGDPSGSVEEVAAAAAKIVQGNMQQITSEQAKDLFREN